MIKHSAVIIIFLLCACFSIGAKAQAVPASVAEKAGGAVATAQKAENYSKYIKKQKKEIKKLLNDTKDQFHALEKKTKELKDLYAKNDNTKEDPEQMAKKMEEAFATSPNDTSEERKEKKYAALRFIKVNVASELNNANENIQKTEQEATQGKMDSDASGTMTGTSETAQILVESVSKQLDSLVKYLQSEIKNLKTETVVLLFEAYGKQEGEREIENIDICRYTKGGCSEGGLISSVTSGAGSVLKTVDDAKNKVGDVAGEVNNVTETVNSVKGAAEGVTDIGKESLESDEDLRGLMG